MLRATTLLGRTLFMCLCFCTIGVWLGVGLWRGVEGFWAVWATVAHDFQVGFCWVSFPWETSRGRDGSVMCVLSLRKTPLKGSVNWPQTIRSVFTRNITPLSVANVSRELIKQPRKTETWTFTRTHSCF